jgi:predicted outer membrane repeat protein
MDLLECEFLNNKAIENSAIEVLEGSRSKNITIYDCYFEKNTALRNTISLSHSNVFINNSRIIRNSATFLTKHLFIGFSNVYI